MNADIAYDPISINEYIDPFMGERVDKKNVKNYFSRHKKKDVIGRLEEWLKFPSEAMSLKS